MGEEQPSDDLFDGVLTLEAHLLQEGRDEGLTAASALGILEGAELGWQQGTALGKDMGYIAGQAKLWSYLQAASPDLFSARASTSLQRLQNLLSALSLEAENHDLQHSVDAVRAQFKQTSTQIGLNPARNVPEKLAF